MKSYCVRSQHVGSSEGVYTDYGATTIGPQIWFDKAKLCDVLRHKIQAWLQTTSGRGAEEPNQHNQNE